MLYVKGLWSTSIDYYDHLQSLPKAGLLWSSTVGYSVKSVNDVVELWSSKIFG